MPLLFLQGGGLSPREGVGESVFAVDWPTGLRAPELGPDWLAQPFGEQLSQVEELLEEACGAVGHGWGAWLLLCAMESLSERNWAPPPTLLLSSFMGSGRYTGQSEAGYALPRTDRIEGALRRGGRLNGAPIRFLHGTLDQQAPLEQLGFVEDEGFSLLRGQCGHRLLGPGRALLEAELIRLRRAIQHASRH